MEGLGAVRRSKDDIRDSTGIKKKENISIERFLRKKRNGKLRNRRHLLHLNIYKLSISDFHEVVKIER